MLALGQEADLALYSHDSLYMTVSDVLEMPSKYTGPQRDLEHDAALL
jgi:hypothetical protein